MPATVIGVASIKGGVAKTATAIELSAALSAEGCRVLVVDLDPQCDLSGAVGVPSSTNYYEEEGDVPEGTVRTLCGAMRRKYPVDAAIARTEWFDLLPGSPNFYEADLMFKDQDDIYALTDILEPLKPFYDFILIDSHPSKDLLLNMLYVASDYMVVPTLADDSSTNGVVNLEQDLRELRESRNHYSHAHILCVILARYKKNDSTYTRALWDLDNALPMLGDQAFLDTVRESNRVTMSRGLHQPVQALERNNNAAVDYRRIAEKIKEAVHYGKSE